MYCLAAILPPAYRRLSMAGMKEVTLGDGSIIKLDTDDDACSHFGFQAGDRVAPEGNSNVATVLGVALVPEGVRCDCSDIDEYLLWVESDDGDVCFVPSHILEQLRKVD